MKKEYLILFALILILGAYLLLQKENKDHYTLPEIKKINISDITGMILDKKDGLVNITKKNDAWFVTDEEYPADPGAVENMLDTLKELRLSALVSQKGDTKRYELTSEDRIRVEVLKGQESIFEFAMGKTAPTGNHTFVMLADDPNVYHANGSFTSYFDKTVDGLRDKTVVEFKEASLEKFTIEKDGISKTLISKKEGGKEADHTITWQTEDGTAFDKEAASDLLSTVSFLTCDTYLSSPGKSDLIKEKPLCRLTFKNKETIELKIFPSEEKDGFNGISSMNDYAFSLNQFNGKNIVSNIEKLLGITRDKEDKE